MLFLLKIEGKRPISGNEICLAGAVKQPGGEG